MNAFLDPAGPLPPSVYWRRRAIVLVLLLLLIGGLWTLISAVTAGSTATPAASATPGATVAACNAKDIALSAVTDSESYAEGEYPQFSMTITNTGDVPCLLEVGSDKQKYIVTSGSDMIWDSTVCQIGSEPYTQELAPSQSVSTSPVEWGRARSDNCDSGTPAVGGGASYQLSVYVGDIESAKSTQFMLY